MDDAEWFDVLGLLEEWNEFPPLEVLARADFGYKPPSEQIQPGDKWFGEDRIPPAVIPEASGPVLEGAPGDMQEMFKLSMARRKALIH